MPVIIVFLGPSLGRAEAEKILSAEYRPPVARGDVTRAMKEGAAIICIIDGVFHQESAVAHREILLAIHKGIRVIGASSMGALRAAELDVLGMVGIGEVYRRYREGNLESDDEVALIFDPSTGLALSEPLVNIRATLQSAEDRGIIDPSTHTMLLAAARGLYYPERTYPRICESAGGALSSLVRDAFLRFAKTEPVDVKRKDAIQALEYIRDQLIP
ncbi:MAG: TfuA-related McrA-glycine thioamidation protein [Methanomicrobiales archaeon]|nr:TfuA-related McrA-glycine thioamidation protein [Methanomicrobiales archaeon]